MQIGDLECFIVNDGQVMVDAGGTFGLVPRTLYEREWTPDDQNHIPMVLQCLFVRSEGKSILIDTGLGDKLTPKGVERWGLTREDGGLIEALQRIGVGVEDVDIVINTHLHSDHCGGNTSMSDGEPTPTFPNATYWVQHMEWADASHPDARTRGTYFPENFTPLFRAGRLRLLHGDTQVTRHVRCVMTPGHTRGHQSVMLSSGGWDGLYVADMASYAVHMQRASWLTAYDVLPLENVRTKRRWQHWAVERQAWLFFEHDRKLPVAQLVEDGKRLKLVAPEGSDKLTAPPPTPRPTP